MTTTIPDALGTKSSDRQPLAEAIAERPTCWQSFRRLPASVMLCLIIVPVSFMLIGLIYRHSCVAKPNVPLFLIVYGMLILVNLFVYALLGSTFLVFVRRARSMSSERGMTMLLAVVSGMIFGTLIFLWWIVGTIWWIKLTLRMRPQLQQPNSLAFCHPVVYWTALAANIFGIIGFLTQICIAIGGDARAPG